VSGLGAGHGSLEPADVAALDFGKSDGLLPAVVQHCDSGAVLMLGYMNPEALRETLRRRRVVFFSRTRGRLWEKGETSGHTLELVSVRSDCDRDALLIAARPAAAVCHLGTSTCFGELPGSAAERLAFLPELESVLARRILERPAGSYTARLCAGGPMRIAQKVGEEGVEVALAAVAGTDEKLVAESADLLFHLLVLLKSRGLGLERIVAELKRRHADAG
jgi:phosphoribosyl-ATP pyrophosphohydrolase/phosphoribosyl-AMP cyclohydrolase